jgi:hypothetical protein
MITVLGSVRRVIFGISTREITVERRGFRCSSKAFQDRIEQIGAAFLGGYHAAIEVPSAKIAGRLEEGPLELRGFSYEGAAMGLALWDLITPWNRRRVRTFLGGTGNRHAYMIHVGAGWLLGRLPLNPDKLRGRFDPLLGWLLIDGYGFHEGFFHWNDYSRGQPPPERLTGYSRRVFDQGLGRSLWFVNGAQPPLIAESIRAFASERQPDMWSGVGLACAYAGGLPDETALHALVAAAGQHRPQLAQGAAFAAKARERAGNITDDTQRASHLLCGMKAEEAAAITDAALENLPAGAAEPSFEIWRRRIQEQFLTRKEIKK